MGHYPLNWRIWIRCTGSSDYLTRLMWYFEIVQALLTKGLQREAAGRGTLALYTSVCPRKLPVT